MNLKDIVVLSETPEDEALLDKAESAFAQVRATTKDIKNQLSFCWAFCYICFA